MRRLKKRARTDAHVNDRRAQGRSYSRWIYLAFLFVFLVAVLDYVWGDFLLFRANGVVVQDRVDIEAGYVGRLDKVPLRIGQSVRQGETLAVFTSIEIAERLAELKLRVAELKQQVLEKKQEIDVAQDLLPIADARVKNSRELRAVLDGLKGKGLASSDRLLDVLIENHSAEEAAIRLRAQLSSDQRAEKALQPALESAETALATLSELYGDGIIKAPVTGILDSKIPARGEIFLTGEKILSLYTGDKYVLAYLPSRHLFPVAVGEDVLLDSGQLVLDGKIDEILPVSDKLPSEFQNTFKPVERTQLARIVISDPQLVPTNTKIRISRKRETLRGITQLAGKAWREIRTIVGSRPDPREVTTGSSAGGTGDVFARPEHVGQTALRNDQADVR
ncbi:HlyD family secretion protein [Roseibium sp.]|uniref:HlyD family secretion protein n=1 Tax=Roseibium sp. TaxID=1936156 RepID=UPI003A97370D